MPVDPPLQRSSYRTLAGENAADAQKPGRTLLRPKGQSSPFSMTAFREVGGVRRGSPAKDSRHSTSHCP